MNDDFKTRLVKEKYELDEKIERLKLFIGSKNFDTVDKYSKYLLPIQLQSMVAYSYILKARIDVL